MESGESQATNLDRKPTAPMRIPSRSGGAPAPGRPRVRALRPRIVAGPGRRSMAAGRCLRGAANPAGAGTPARKRRKDGPPGSPEGEAKGRQSHDHENQTPSHLSLPELAAGPVPLDGGHSRVRPEAAAGARAVSGRERRSGDWRSVSRRIGTRACCLRFS